MVMTSARLCACATGVEASQLRTGCVCMGGDGGGCQAKSHLEIPTNIGSMTKCEIHYRNQLKGLKKGDSK